MKAALVYRISGTAANAFQTLCAVPSDERGFFDLFTLVVQILDALWLVVATLGSGLAL
jgi:hypothetical protein